MTWHKRLRIGLWVAVGLAAAGSVAIALTRSLPTRPAESVAPQPHSGLVGKPLPELALQDLDGHAVRVAQLKGRPALVNFWATWCIPCRAEMPDIEHEWRLWRGRAAFIGIDDGEDVASVRSFVQELGVSYTIWRYPQTDIERVFDAPGLPYTVFLDRSSVIRTVFLGQMSRDYIEKQLRALAGSTG